MAAKDNLKELLQERFTDHEVGVDPGVWQSISTQLVAAAPAADGLGDLLKERFREHETHVDPGVWEGISQQLGHGAAAGSAAGGSGFGGWLAAGIAATVVTGGLLFWALSPEPQARATASNSPARPSTASTQAPVPTVTTTEQAAPVLAATGANTTMAAPPRELQAPARTEPSPVESPSRSNGTTPGETPPVQAGPVRTMERSTTPTPTEGAHLAEVNRIIERLILQTQAEPVVAQTESLPEAGLVQGQTPALLPNVFEEPDETAGETPSASAPVVWIPNAFSPGQRDGVNDELVVVAEGLTGIQVRIYSLDSRLIFSANDLKAWDGHDLSGQLCQQGYYFYAIEGLDGTNKTFSKGQTIYLFR
jgi:hypothetical protein